MTRKDLQELANLRLHEAQILLSQQSASGAYYLAGYAVECALKACIARSTQAYEFPDLSRVRKALDVYTWLAHRLCRIPRSKPAAISWDALQTQFGPEYASSKKFRDDFRETLRRVQAVYRAANVGHTSDGRVELRRSDPPVVKTTLTVTGKNPQTV